MSKLIQFFRKLFTKEIWKSIKGYEGLYEISNKGRVKTLKRKGVIVDKILKQNLNSRGYYHVGLSKNKKSKTIMIHILMRNTFFDKKSNNKDFEIDHINGIRIDNCVDNLQLLSHRQNLLKGHLQNGRKSSKYSGVYWDKTAKKWRVNIWTYGGSKYLGLFRNEYQAHLVYQKELKRINN